MKVTVQETPFSEIVFGIHPFPTGKMVVAMTAGSVCWIGFNHGKERLRKEFKGANITEDPAATKKAAAEIARAWPKGFQKFSFPLVLRGTDFQVKVWKELLKIKTGKTVTYSDIAQKIGKPLAVRAVGTAVGRNPLSVIVPCHRVVNKSSGRINYGWGAEMKKDLLRREGVSL